MRVEVKSRIEPNVAVGRVDVTCLIKSVQIDPVLIKRIDPFAAIDPGPASAVIEGGAGIPEHGRHDQISGVSADWVPVRESEILIVQHLANNSFELIEHEPMPGEEKPLLILLGIRWVVDVRLALVPNGNFRAACPSGFNSRATGRETWTVGGHTPTMMHASFQTGCHDSIGLNSAWELGGVLSRKMTEYLKRVHFLTMLSKS